MSDNATSPYIEEAAKEAAGKSASEAGGNANAEENAEEGEVGVSAGDGLAAEDDVRAASETERLEEEKRQLRDLLQRKQAEFENYRKRVDRERADTLKYAAAEIVREVLPVLDNLERAVGAVEPGSEQQLREGVEIIYKQFRDILAKQGLAEVEALDRAFDPHVHEAVSRVESADHPEGTIVSVFQKGFLFKDRLLRPSMVSVARRPNDDGDEMDPRTDGESESTEPRGSEDRVVHRND